MVHNLATAVPHRPIYLPDYSMLLGCKCGQRFEPADSDDEYAAHIAALTPLAS